MLDVAADLPGLVSDNPVHLGDLPPPRVVHAGCLGAKAVVGHGHTVAREAKPALLSPVPPDDRVMAIESMSGAPRWAITLKYSVKINIRRSGGRVGSTLAGEACSSPVGSASHASGAARRGGRAAGPAARSGTATTRG